MNYNQVLGVGHNASAAEIQQAFRKAALEQHPDHSDSPEAAQAFARIKEARDELIKQATARGTEDVQQVTTAAIKAAAVAFIAVPVIPIYDGFTPEEITRIQQLDQLAAQYAKRPLFARFNESNEVKKHRKKLKTNTRRLQGLY